MLYHDGWLYLSGRGTVRRYRQSLPNGKWDIRETIAQGFCGFHHHQVSGLTLGHDGRLYITSGDDDNAVEGSDGSRASAFRAIISDTSAAISAGGSQSRINVGRCIGATDSSSCRRSHRKAAAGRST